MAVRQIEPIDRAKLRATIQKWIDAHTDVDDTDGVGLLEDVLWEINAQPTLTPPNEWVSVETPPTTQGWYHVAVLDLKTGKYTVEQDLYSIELAKAYGFEPGFCKANRWEERERIDYWCRFPEPPDRRPPERQGGDVDHA